MRTRKEIEEEMKNNISGSWWNISLELLLDIRDSLYSPHSLDEASEKKSVIPLEDSGDVSQDNSETNSQDNLVEQEVFKSDPPTSHTEPLKSDKGVGFGSLDTCQDDWDISLCSKCGCMTKTIKGNCGKCKAIKQDINDMCKCGHERQWHDHNKECRVDIADHPDINCECEKFVFQDKRECINAEDICECNHNRQSHNVDGCRLVDCECSKFHIPDKEGITSQSFNEISNDSDAPINQNLDKSAPSVPEEQQNEVPELTGEEERNIARTPTEVETKKEAHKGYPLSELNEGENNGS